jgi:PAS domain S-box-containing protein
MQKWQLMKNDIRQLIDFEKLNALLEGFNKTTGFVTAILDLEGNVLSQSGWRQICTEFHRVNPETSKKCTISDTVLANKMAEGEKYHFYKCLNGLVDVAVPIVIDGEHIANLFSGQFFFDEPDVSFFRKQAEKYGFDEEKYLAALKKVPVVSEDKVKTAMDFLLDMTLLISETTLQKQKQTELNRKINEEKERTEESEEKYRFMFENMAQGILLQSANGSIVDANPALIEMFGLSKDELLGRTSIDPRWKIIHEDGTDFPGSEHPSWKAIETGQAIKDVMAGVFNPRKNEYTWLHINAFPIFKLEEEKPFQSFVTMHDITERIKAEKALQMTRYSFDHASDQLFWITADARIVDVNDSACQILGYSREELLQLTIPDIDVNFNAQMWSQHFNDLRQNGSIKFESTQITKNGRQFPIEGVANYIKFGDEELNFSFVRDITERKLTEQALIKNQEDLQTKNERLFAVNKELIKAKERAEESEEKFKAIVENGSVLLTLTDAQGRVKFASPQCEKVIGWKKEDIIGVSLPYFIHPDDKQKVAVEREKATSLRPIKDFEYRIIDNKKKIRWISHSAALIKKGDSFSILSTIINITERKEAEEALQKTINQRDLLAKHVPGVLYQYRLRPDGSSHFPYASDGILDIYGVTPEEVLHDATCVFKVLHPDDVERVSETIQESARNLKVWYDTYRVKHLNGQTIWVEGESTPQLLEDGSILWHGYIRNITKRKQAEEQLRKLSQAVEQSPASVVITSPSGNIEYVNQKFTEVTGYSLNEAIGQNPRILKSGEQSEAFYKELWETISLGKEWKGEMHNKTKNGELYWESARISPISNEKGEITNYLAVKEDITDLKQAEINFRYSIDLSPVGIRIVSIDGETVYANQAFLGIYDFASLNEFMATPSVDRYTPESYLEHLERKKTRKEGGEVAEYEIKIKRRNGEVRQIKVWRKEVIWNKEKHFQVINQDITEQRNLYNELLIAKEKAEENEQRLRLLYNSLSIAVLILKDGVCIECNNAALNIYSVDNKDQIVGKTPGDFSPEYQPNNIKSIEVAKSKNQIAIEEGYTSFEWLARRKNKEEFYTEVSLTKFIYKDELYIQCLTTDITERKRIENELIAAKVRAEESAEKLKTANLDLELAQNIALIGNWSFNPEVGVPVWSDEVYNIYELDLSTKPPHISEYKELYEPDTYEMFTNAIINGIGYDIELNIKVSDKKSKWIRSICLPDLKNKTSKGFLLRGTTQDITKQKETEIELLTAKEKAEESDRLKSSFLANMSHEIRTPMNGILGFLDLLQEPDLEEETKNTYIDIMGKSGQRLLNTINNIIEISKIDAKQVKIKEERFCIVALLQELSDFFQAEAKAKGINLLAKLPEQSIEITSDRTMLESVFTNLIKNALKFTRLGEIEVCLEQNNGHLTAYVSDTGIGIAPEKIEHLFERFIQGSESNLTRKFEGSGLGLSITKEYVNLLGGKIWVDSEVDKGSVFYVELSGNALNS